MGTVRGDVGWPNRGALLHTKAWRCPGAMGWGRHDGCGNGGRDGRACLGELEWEQSPKITLKREVHSAVPSGEGELK